MNNDFNIIRLKETESTNTYAKALLKQGELSAPFALVFADNQTKGRGRLGRTWESREGDTLCMSLVAPFPFKPAVTLLSALAVHQTLTEICKEIKEDLKIKWPNDIVIKNKKLCGILTESTDKAAVIGIGINLNSTSFSDEITSKATSLKLLTDKEFDAFDISQKIAENLVNLLKKSNGEFTDSAHKEYTSLCINLGREVICGDKKGIATGIDKCGSLIIKTEDTTEKISSGEVFISGIY